MSENSDLPSLLQKNAERLLAIANYTVVDYFIKKKHFGTNILHNIYMLTVCAFYLYCQLKPLFHEEKKK